MWPHKRFHQQSYPYGDAYNLNITAHDREYINMMINENNYYRNLLNNTYDYQNNQEHSMHNTTPPLQPPTTQPPRPQPSSTPLSFSSSTLDYDTILLFHDEKIEKYRVELNNLKLDFNCCKEILTKQLEMNASLLNRLFHS